MASTLLPPDLFTTFKQYKLDTEHIAGWLASTAEKCGFVRASRSVEKAPKLKGRARKLARDAAKAEKNDKEAPQYITHVHEFLPMAKHISKHTPKIVAPKGMSVVLDRVIGARKKCTEWFKENSHGDTSINETHAHFTGVMSSISDVLRPCWAPSDTKQDEKKTSGSKGPIGTPLSSNTNLFEHLELEEIGSSDDELPKSVKSGCSALVISNLPRASIQLDEKLLEEEFMFAVHTFVDDMQQVRKYLNSIWRSYHGGEIDLLVASVITNTAIDLVRQAERSFGSLLKRPKKYPVEKYPTGVLPAILYHEHMRDDMQRLDTGMVVDLDSTLNPTMEKNVHLCECPSKDFCFHPVFIALKIYCNKVDDVWHRTGKGYSVPYGLDTMMGESERIVFAGNIDDNGADATRDVKRRLLKYLTEMQAAVCSCQSIFAEDEIMAGVRHMMMKREIPFWAIFGCQIFVDIQDELEDCTANALKDVRAALRKAQQAHREHCDYVEALPYTVWDSRYDEELQSVLNDQHSWVFADELGKIKKEDIHFDESGRFHSEPDTLIKAHPLRCGMLKYDLYLQLHKMGIDLVNESGHVLMMCHLYVAARLAVSDMPQWPDLELVIAKHSPERLFVGGLPKDLTQCFKRFSLACGSSAVTFARNRRNNNHVFRTKNLRLLRSSSAISEVFYERISGWSRDPDISVRKLQSLLIDVKHVQRIDEQMDPESKLHKKLARTLKIPTERKLVQLLRTLGISLVAEMPELCYDYFSLQRRCSDIFDQLHSSLFSQAVDDCNLPSSPVLPTMRILELASFGQTLHSNKVDASVLLCQMGFGPDQSPLGNAANRLNAQLYTGISLDEINFLHANNGIAPSVQQVAARPLEQVADIIQVMFERGEGDVEIKKLHAVAGGTDYGCFMFSQKMLQSLYGDLGPSQADSKPWAEIVYKSRKRDMGRCQFREHAQTAGQKRINKRIGRKLGLELMAYVLGGVTRLAGKRNGWPEEDIERTASFVEANIEYMVKREGVENLSEMIGSMSLDPEAECDMEAETAE